MTTPKSSEAWRDLLWTLAFLAVVLAWDVSGADLQTVRWVGGSHSFAWRNNWLLAGFFHEGGRWLSAMAAGVVVVNVVRPWSFARDMSAWSRWWWCLATIACLVLIPTLKHGSATSCPWDLAEFGGHAHYVSHWALGVSDGGPGGCFPSGHASAAFGFFSGWFVLRATAPKAARRWLAGVWLCGIAFGIAQLLRGAHYPSHSMWTAWLCWALSALMWHASRPLCGMATRPAEVPVGG